MKRVIFYIVVVIVAVAIGLSPAGKWFYSYFGGESRSGVSQLSVKSARGDYTVFIDGNSVGKVEDGKTQLFAKINPGNRDVKLVRDTDVTGFYFDFSRKIEFTPSSQVEIEWDAGPTLESSSGTVKYFTEIEKPEGSEVLVEAFPADAKILLDGKESENDVFEILDGTIHTLRVSNGEGYESKDIDIAIRDEQTNKVLTNLRLIVEVYLYKQPFI